MMSSRAASAALYRHFLSGYFELETTSGQLEAGISIWNFIALLAVPGVFASGFSLMKTGPMLVRPPADFVISALDDRIMFIVLTIVVVGLVTVLNLHKLLPDQRERQILHLLPVRALTLIGIKLAAFTSFIFLFFAVFNAASCVIYPISAVPLSADSRMMLRFFTAHIVTVSIASVFTFAFFTCTYGLVTIFFPRAVWPRISSMFQLISVSALVSFLFVGLLSLRQLQYAPEVAKVNPALWFLGTYQTKLHEADLSLLVKNNLLVMHFGNLAATAWLATVLAMLLGFGLIVSALVLENSRGEITGKTTNSRMFSQLLRSAARVLSPSGLTRAVFQFSALTLLRVQECQIFLAAYIGVGAGLILNELVSSSDSSSLSFTAPLTLSFVLLTGLVGIAKVPVVLDANWIFQLSPDQNCDAASDGVLKVILSFGLFPLFLALAPVYVYRVGVAAATIFLIYCASLAVLLLQALTWKWDLVPFTFEQNVSKTNLPLWVVAYAIALAAYVAIFGDFAAWLSESRPRALIADALLIALCAGVHLYREQNGTDGQIAFEEVDIDAVQLLNLGTR